MKIVRRYLFTFLILILSLLSLFGWWHSTRVWTAWVAETPYGIFKLQSESSVFGFGGQFMEHDQRWAAYSNSDAISGDHMQWISGFPDFQFGDGLYFLILPYWELFTALSAGAGICGLLERRRIRRRIGNS